MPQIRLSAIQFATTDDVEANLATCLRMIDAAAIHHPHLIVTPEFINHILWFDDTDHCWRVSVDPDGPFLRALGDKAREHAVYLKVNVTLRRPNHTVTGSNILFDPSGQIITITDKQILMGNENNFLTPASEAAEIITTPFGKLGMYCCMDGVIPEPARALAVGGAHILLNSLNSFAHDEASLHIPVRSGENKVFVVAANKVGGLVPPPMAQIVAGRLKIPASAIAGAGESQILAPDGTVLARAPREGEAVIFADVDVAEAEDKRRPDGTDILAARRPDLYHSLAAPPSPRRPVAPSPQLEVAVGQLVGPDRVAEAVGLVHAAATRPLSLLVLPELFYHQEGTTPPPAGPVLTALQDALGNADCLIATTIAEAQAHVGIVLGREGILLRQPQLHHCGRHPWAENLGDQLHVLDLPWGRLALVTGGDAIYPEVFRLAVLQDVDVVAVPTKVLETWEMQTGFLERAAENRMNLVVATEPSAHGTSAIFALDKDFTLWTQWEKPFDGHINYPLITRAPHAPGLTRATVYPAQAANRLISQKTDLVANRPWQLVRGVLTSGERGREKRMVNG